MKHVSRDNQGHNGDKGGDKQLPMPQIALKEEGDEGKDGADDAAHRLGTEMQDDTRHETAEAAQQTDEHHATLFEDSGETHCTTT